MIQTALISRWGSLLFSFVRRYHFILGHESKKRVDWLKFLSRNNVCVCVCAYCMLIVYLHFGHNDGGNGSGGGL